MADYILRSQLLHDKENFVDSATIKNNVLLPRGHIASSHCVSRERRELSSNSTTALGQWNEWDISSQNGLLLDDVYVQGTNAVCTGGVNAVLTATSGASLVNADAGFFQLQWIDPNTNECAVTKPLDYNATTTAIKNALEALPNFNGTVTVGGGVIGVAGTPTTFTLAGDYQNTVIPATSLTVITGTLGDGGAYDDVLVTVTTAGVSDKYCDYFGLNLIEEIELLDGSNHSVQNFKYAEVMNYILKTLPEEVEANILRLAGGSGSSAMASGNFICPLPLFFSAITAYGQYVPPLASNLLKGTNIMRLRLKFRAGSELVSSSSLTAGAISNVALVCNYIMPDNAVIKEMEALADNLPPYIAYDFDNISENSVSDNTATHIDITGINGSLKAISLGCHKVTDWDDNNKRYVNYEIDQLTLRADGKELESITIDKALEYENIWYGSVPHKHSTNGHPTVMSFNALPSTMSKPGSYFGSLNTRGTKKLELRDVKHTEAGATCYVNVVGVHFAKFFIRGGKMWRERG